MDGSTVLPGLDLQGSSTRIADGFDKADMGILVTNVEFTSAGNVHTIRKSISAKDRKSSKFC